MTDDNVRKAATEDTELIEAVRWLSTHGCNSAPWYTKAGNVLLAQYEARKRSADAASRKERMADLAVRLAASEVGYTLTREQATELAEFLSEER